tara:strand:- start:4595 stop:5374 length:780 start_codon:yes stop_codon:yes gene_type:complete
MIKLFKGQWLLFFFLFFFSFEIYASFTNGIYLSTMMGCSKSGTSPLTIQYEDRAHETISANYKNRCFSGSHWWAFRLENWTDQTGWGLELIHHKIYLVNTTENLESFSVSDGYNLLFLNFAKQLGDINLRVGFGGVLAHVDATVLGRTRYIRKGFQGHYLTGPAFQINVEKLLWQSTTHFVSFDTKFTAAYAEVPISANNNELAIVPDHAIHLSISLGSKPEAYSNKKGLYENLLYFAPLIYPITTGYIMGTGFLPGGY